jgi:putative transcriptional regulator
VSEIMKREKLKALRLKAGYSQEWVASRIGVNQKAISSYENGNKTPSLGTAKKLAKFYKVKIEDIL